MTCRAMLAERLQALFERMDEEQLAAVERALDSIHPWDDVETTRRKMEEALEGVGKAEPPGSRSPA